MRQDLTNAFRLLVRQPGFTIAAVLTLALGIGANAAVFTLAWHLILKPLPWPEPGRIVQVWGTSTKTGEINVLAPANYLDFEREARSFDAIAAYNFFPFALNLTGAEEPLELHVRAVTGQYFAVFGTAALLGRPIAPPDFEEASPVVVLSEGLWRQRFGEDRTIVGRTVVLDGRAHEVIGVMPASFDVSPRALDAWIPWVFSPDTRERRQGYFLASVGRLKPGVSLEQARDDVTAIAARASAAFPGTNAQVGVTLKPIADELSGGIRRGVLVIAGAAGLVLLIACANLTSLQLARGAGRAKELAVRAAIGATRGRLLRQLLTEGGVLAIVAGHFGLFAGVSTARALVASAPPDLVRVGDLSVDSAIVVYTFLLSVAAGVAFAWFPAWRATRPAQPGALAGRGAVDQRQGSIRTVLMTLEVAVATLLLISALALVSGMMKVLRVDPGLDVEHVVAADLSLPSRYETVKARTAFFDELAGRLESVPGVVASCAINMVPFESSPGTMTYVAESSRTTVSALPLVVTPGCFRTLGVAQIAGRPFERHEPSPVAIVSEGFARRAFGTTDAVGRVIRVGLATGDPLTVVGVVSDARYLSLERTPYAQVYQLASQTGYFTPTKVLVRAHHGPDAIAGVLRAEVRGLDPAQPVARVRTIAASLVKSLAPRRFTLTLLAGFAALALLLAGTGVYGLLAQLVAQRRAEIGVRMALGADGRSVVRLVTAGALRSVVFGMIAGSVAAWMAGRVLARLASDVTPDDPVLYVTALGVLLGVATVAAWVPARRATRIDPIVALRAE